MIAGLAARARSLWRGVRRRSEVEAEMQEEFRLHLDLRTEDLMRSGLSPAEARRRARLEFGSSERYKDEGRESRGLRGVDEIRLSWLDFKLGLRMLVRYPGLTLVGGLAMAFAIAAGAATFELVTAVVHPVLPLAGGDRIVGLQNWDTAASQPEDRALHDFAVWRAGLESVEELGAFRTLERNLILGEDGGEPVRIAEISTSAFRVARIPPLLGRVLVEADEQPGAPRVALLGHRVWQTRFAGDRQVLGRTVRLGTSQATVVGVMPEGFAFPVNHGFWIPLRLNAGDYQEREGPEIRVFGRLAPGATLRQAQAELTALGQRLAADSPDTHRHLRPEVLSYGKALFPMRLDGMFVAGAYSLNLFLMLFLVVVCANVGALVFARTATREGEIVVRTALGASRRRIIMQLFAEALVLGGVAAFVGLAAAESALRWGLGVMEAVNGQLPFWLRASLSPATVLYAVGLTALGAGLAGVMPALKVTRGIASRLRQAAVPGSGLRFGGLLTGVIVVQVAFTALFLPIAIDTALDMLRAEAPDVGFPAEEYLSVELRMDRETPAGVAADKAEAEFRARFDATHRELERRLTAEPGVLAVTYASGLPGGYHPRQRIEVEGATAGPTSAELVQVASVAPNFFGVLGTPVLAGRAFQAGDVESAARAVIVNRSFAREVLGERSAIGRRVRFLDPEDGGAPQPDQPPGPWHEIVGVVEDTALTTDPDLPHNAGLYLPVAPSGALPVKLAVHVNGEPASFAARLRALATAVDPTLRLYELRPLDDIQWDLRMTYVFWLQVLVLASAVALLLSLAGIYSVISFTVARRTREIGIRIALGADRRRVVAAIFWRAFAQLGLGILVGIGLLAALDGGLPSARFVGLVAAGVGFMAGAGALACLVPTRRALRIEPTEALRADG